MEKGINSMEEGTQEGKFYMHLADAWQRMNRTSDVRAFFLLPVFASRFNRKSAFIFR